MNYFYFCALFSISKERFLRFLSSFVAYFPGFRRRVESSFFVPGVLGSGIELLVDEIFHPLK